MRRRIFYTPAFVFLISAGLLVSGLLFWLPNRRVINADTELGVALLGGATVALAVAWGQAVGTHQAERRSLQVELSRSSDHRGINLDKRDLTRLWMNGRDFTGASMRHANLAGADLREATLAEANLIGANLGRHAAGYVTSLYKANLRKASLWGTRGGHCELTWAVLDEAMIQSARFKNARLTESSFRNCLIMGGDFRRTEAINCNFADARLLGADFRKANLYGSTFAGARVCCDLREANLGDTDLSLAIDLDHSQLEGATYSPKPGTTDRVGGEGLTG